MKLTKIILTGSLVLGALVPTAVMANVAKASVALTLADTNYINYNNTYYTAAERAAYAAKDLYFHHYDNTLAMTPGRNDFTPSFGTVKNDLQGSFWDKEKPLLGDWVNSANAGGAYRPIDVPTKFVMAQKYFIQARSEMKLQTYAFNGFLHEIAWKYTWGESSFYNELVQHEQEYNNDKILYQQELAKAQGTSIPTTKPTYTALDHKYLNYVTDYFTKEEKRLYDEKYLYFWKYDGTLRGKKDGTLTGTFWAKEQSIMNNPAYSYLSNNAFTASDVPPKFGQAHIYFKKAGAEIDGEGISFRTLLYAVANKNQKGKQTAFNDLAQHEKNYQKYKNLYFEEISKLNKIYK